MEIAALMIWKMFCLIVSINLISLIGWIEGLTVGRLRQRGLCLDRRDAIWQIYGPATGEGRRGLVSNGACRPVSSSLAPGEDKRSSAEFAAFVTVFPFCTVFCDVFVCIAQDWVVTHVPFRMVDSNLPSSSVWYTNYVRLRVLYKLLQLSNFKAVIL